MLEKGNREQGTGNREQSEKIRRFKCQKQLLVILLGHRQFSYFNK
jgi:hypothetical protein